MVKMCLLLCVLTLLWSVPMAVQSAAPAPTQDCSTVILTMTDCLSYVTSGSTIAKPEGGCCSGLKTVLKTAPECLCETFKNSGQLGISLNMTKALNIPAACGIKSPPMSNCGISLASPPGASPPGHSPKKSPKTPKTPSPSALPLAPTLPPSGSSEAPSSSASAGAPGQSLPKSGASAISLSFVLLVGIIMASFSHI
ncbi:hypothetical protein ACHQM5_022407 [Ranunculus cassubicifolius]